MTRATYETTDLKDELRFRVVREYGLARKMLSGPVLAVLGAFFLGYYYMPRRWLLPLVLFAFLTGLIVMARERAAILIVSKLEFRSYGRIRGEPSSVRIACIANVRWLEHHEEREGGSDFPHEPGGLYAVLDKGNCCLLPYLSENQTRDIIHRIEQKFPVMVDQWRRNSPYGQSFTILQIPGPRNAA